MGTGRATKKAKKLKNMFEYLHNKVEQVEEERNYDRSWETKEHLIKLKKQKLALKDQIKRK
tara:strand:- start:1105 stop:1287 length:183 start_codon:yes stop_codon:yes gene_type:complete